MEDFRIRRLSRLLRIVFPNPCAHARVDVSWQRQSDLHTFRVAEENLGRATCDYQIIPEVIPQIGEFTNESIQSVNQEASWAIIQGLKLASHSLAPRSRADLPDSWNFKIHYYVVGIPAAPNI